MLHSIYDACLRRCSIAAIVPLLAVFLASPVAQAAPSQDARVPVEQPPDGTTVLRTTRILDGTGNVLEDRDVVVRDGRIAEIVAGGSTRGDRVYNLTGLTVLPGYIDTHVHLSRHFDPNGRLHSPADRSAIGHVTLYGAENADRTLISGVTMVQSLGAADNADLKAWITRGTIPGPRMLSSLGAVSEDTGTPDRIREFVRGRAAAGADVVKVFASTSIRFGGVTNLSAAQLDAACGEARAQGLRAVVHAHRADAVQLAADAGCMQIEHGWLLDGADLELIADSGMYFGNQIDLLFRNYEEHAEGYDGIGGYTIEGFANLQAARPGALEAFKRSLDTPGLRVVYNSTDANAGSHGRNAEELVAYVQQGGQEPMAAESLGLGDRIGSIAPGLDADIIAIDGDPMAHAGALGRVVFVMRGDRVHKNEPATGAGR